MPGTRRRRTPPSRRCRFKHCHNLPSASVPGGQGGGSPLCDIGQSSGTCPFVCFLAYAPKTGWSPTGQNLQSDKYRAADIMPATNDPATNMVKAQYSIASALSPHLGSLITGTDAPANIDPNGPHSRRAPSRSLGRPTAARCKRRPSDCPRRRQPSGNASSDPRPLHAPWAACRCARRAASRDDRARLWVRQQGKGGPHGTTRPFRAPRCPRGEYADLRRTRSARRRPIRRPACNRTIGQQGRQLPQG